MLITVFYTDSKKKKYTEKIKFGLGDLNLSDVNVMQDKPNRGSSVTFLFFPWMDFGPIGLWAFALIFTA